MTKMCVKIVYLHFENLFLIRAAFQNSPTFFFYHFLRIRFRFVCLLVVLDGVFLFDISAKRRHLLSKNRYLFIAQFWHTLHRLNVIQTSDRTLFSLFIRWLVNVCVVYSNRSFLWIFRVLSSLWFRVKKKTIWKVQPFRAFMFHSLCQAFSRMSFYAVANGRSVGIFNTW